MAVFIAGFGTGRASGGTENPTATKRSLTNYTTNKAADTKTVAKPDTKKFAATPAKGTTPVDPANCFIKGSKSKTYHIPGGSFYERTKPAACFNSEEEAVAAGYTKSSR